MMVTSSISVTLEDCECRNYSKTLADEVKTVNIDTETRAHMKKMRNDVGRFG